MRVCVRVCVCVCVCVWCVCARARARALVLNVRHAKSMCRITSPSVACVALQYPSTLPHKRQNFRKQFSGYKTCFDFLYEFRPTYLLLYEEFSKT
jgi:hypothetical protein